MEKSPEEDSNTYRSSTFYQSRQSKNSVHQNETEKFFDKNLQKIQGNHRGTI